MNPRFALRRGRSILRIAGLLVLILALASAALAQEHKFAVALFHCNLQYVVGGSLGMLPFPFLLDWFPTWEMGEAAMEDMIIKRGFEPTLDIYLRHPTWGVDIELQSYYIEVLAERHPDVLDKLKTLADRGQAEIVSFHYSDQLFLGFGRPVWEKSIERTKRIFADNNLPLSDVVFTQEGQSGLGMAAAMEDHGYNHLVWPKNLWKEQHGEWTAEPYYKFGNLDMVAGPKDVNYNAGELQLTWTFLGDGELLVACGIDPYFPPVFRPYGQCIQEYEAELTQLEADGWDIATVGEYIHAAQDLGITPADPPPLFDGTWQPDSTDGIHRWLGGKGQIPFNADDERDNHVRTLCEIAYRELMAAQTAADAAGLDYDDVFDELWRLMNLAMVTDGSGINPIAGEIGYCISRSAEVARRARLIIEEAKEVLGEAAVKIDTAAGTVESGAPPDEPPVVETGPIDVDIKPGWRTATPVWHQVSADPEIWRLDIHFGKAKTRYLCVTFPGDSPQVIVTPGLTDDQPVAYNRADFSFDHWWLALPNGMINLTDDTFVIKDMGLMHLAAMIVPDNGDVTFRDDVATPDSAVTWRFYIYRGTVDEAVAFANSLNVYPTLYR